MRDFIDNHCRNGGRAVVLDRTERGDMIVIRHGRRSMQLAWTHLLPSTFGGTALFNVANAMAAAGAAFASGAGLHEIRQGLRTFTTSYYLSPGRMNQINVHNVDVIVDYCHNAPGMRVLGEFLERYAAMKAGQTDLGKISRIGMIATAGDRRESDMRELGAVAAEHFDVVVVREDERLRGRERGFTAELVAEGAAQPDRRARRALPPGRDRARRDRGGAPRHGPRQPGRHRRDERRPARGGDGRAGVDDQAGPAGHAHPRRRRATRTSTPGPCRRRPGRPATARPATSSRPRPPADPRGPRRAEGKTPGDPRGYPSTMASEGTSRTRPSRLRAAAGAFATNWRNPELRRAQAAFFGAWTAEWAVTVVLAVYAYGRGGATEVGVVALVRVLPAAIVAPLATQYADRWPREKVLVAVSFARSVSIALAGWAVFVDGPALIVYALVTVSSAPPCSSGRSTPHCCRRCAPPRRSSPAPTSSAGRWTRPRPWPGRP